MEATVPELVQVGIVNDERPLWDTVFQQEYEAWLDSLDKEECQHGINRDSGHPCLECIVEKGDEDALRTDR